MSWFRGNKVQATFITAAILCYLFLSVYLSNVKNNCTAQLREKDLGQAALVADVIANIRNDFYGGSLLRKLTAEDSNLLTHHERYLVPDLVPSTVHYIWCGQRTFTFNHYLSVLSIVKFINPDKIVFHYEQYPEVDAKWYHQWFLDLKDDLPFLHVRQLQDSAGCSRNAEKRLSYILVLLSQHGGIYVSESTVITSFPLQLRNMSFVMAYYNFTGYIVTKPITLIKQSIHQLIKSKHKDTINTKCASIDEYNERLDSFNCVNVPSSFYPQDIWQRDDNFGRMARFLYYGKEEIPKPRYSTDELIPNIAHMVWLKGTSIDFLLYLSMLSVLHVANVDVLYMYGDKEPSGYYWNRIKHHPRLKYIQREIPSTIYQNGVDELSHISDIWRVDLITKYGGIYIDADVIWVKPLDEYMRGYDAVATYDWPQWNLPFPEIINFGVSMGKKNNTFFRLFQESMKFWRENSWTFNGLRQPYKVFERHPDLLNIDPHFQVICFFYKCHPTWNEDYHNINISHLNTPFDWRKDTYALHFTYPTPPELRHHIRFLRAKDSMFKDIAKFVLRKANITDWKY